MLLGVRHAARLGSDFAAYAVVNRVWWIVPLVMADRRARGKAAGAAATVPAAG